MDNIDEVQEKPLKALITDKGYNQTTLAKAIKVSPRIVRYYVAGEKMPTLDVFVEMCKVLRCSPKILISAFGLDVSNIPDDE